MRRFIPRKVLFLALATVLPLSLVGIWAGSASAGGPSFNGPATGTVTCKGVNVKVSFSPPATNTTGGNNVAIKGKLSGCTVSGSTSGTEVIQQGKITGSSSGSGGGCAALVTGTNNAIHVTIVWKGKDNNGKAKFTNTTGTLVGAASATDGSGNVGFEVPNPADSGSSVSGSFAGSTTDHSFLYSSQSPTAIATLCGGHGLKKLSLTHGTVIVP